MWNGRGLKSAKKDHILFEQPLKTLGNYNTTTKKNLTFQVKIYKINVHKGRVSYECNIGKREGE